MQRLTGADKTAWREAKSNQKKEAAVGAQLMREITDPPNQTSFAIISDPTWRPSSPHLQPTWAPQPERKCGGHGGDDDNPIAAAASEDPKRALSATGGAKAAASCATEDMHTLIRALKTDLSCMSVRLERLEALLSA